MKTRISKKGIVIILVVTIVGFGSYVYAQRGMGYGPRGGGYHHNKGGGYHSNCPNFGSGQGYMHSSLTEDDINKINESRQKFMKRTEDLNQKILENQMALKSELVKKNPDAKKAVKIQKELSELEAKFNEKQVKHIIEVKKINPNAGMWMGSMKGGGKRGCSSRRGSW